MFPFFFPFFIIDVIDGTEVFYARLSKGVVDNPMFRHKLSILWLCTPPEVCDVNVDDLFDSHSDVSCDVDFDVQLGLLHHYHRSRCGLSLHRSCREPSLSRLSM